MEKKRDYLDNQKEMVEHPEHYQGTNGIECIDAMIAAFGVDWVYHFCVLNSFKYNFRMNNKGKTEEDLKKSIWYSNKALELLKQIDNG